MDANIFAKKDIFISDFGGFEIYKGDFFGFLLFNVRYSTLIHLYRPSDSTVSEDAGIEPRTVATPELAVEIYSRVQRF